MTAFSRDIHCKQEHVVKINESMYQYPVFPLANEISLVKLLNCPCKIHILQ